MTQALNITPILRRLPPTETEIAVERLRPEQRAYFDHLLRSWGYKPLPKGGVALWWDFARAQRHALRKVRQNRP